MDKAAHDEYVKMRVAVGRRTVSTGAIVKALRYKMATTNYRGMIVDASENSESLFGEKLSKNLLTQWWSGQIRLHAGEFPIGDYTWEEYQSFLDAPSGRKLRK